MLTGTVFYLKINVERTNISAVWTLLSHARGTPPRFFGVSFLSAMLYSLRGVGQTHLLPELFPSTLHFLMLL